MPPNKEHHIQTHLDRLLQERRMTLTELADRVDVTIVNLSVLKSGKVRFPIARRRIAVVSGGIMAIQRG